MINETITSTNTNMSIKPPVLKLLDNQVTETYATIQDVINSDGTEDLKYLVVAKDEVRRTMIILDNCIKLILDNEPKRESK